MNARITALATLAGVLLLSSDALAQSVFEARTEDGNEATMPLTSERIVATIHGQYATTTVRQVYQNTSESTLEGRYTITAGDGARVQGFSYWNGEQKIVGEVFEKEVAQAVYEEVTGLGRDPGLLEQVGEGTFSFRVFPIAAQEKKPIEVSLGKWLPRSSERVEYRMPIDGADSSISVTIDDERGIENIDSSTHTLETTKAADGTTLIRAKGAKAGAKEFVLTYEPKAKPWALQSYVHMDEGHDGYLAVTLATPANVGSTKVSAKDVTLVLDRSGSMAGEPIKHAKLAARAVVSRLADTDKVNVVLFDDGVESLYPTPRKISDDVRQEVLDYIDRVSDAGGTDIAGALRYALRAQVDDAMPNVVLFLTDGQSSAQEAIAAAKSDASDARLFTIGVGGGVEKPLLSRLAKEKRGRFTFIESPDAISARVKTLYSQIESPVMVDVEVVVEGVMLARRYPRSMPDLYKGDELRITSRVRGEGVAKIAVRGLVAGKPVEYRTTATVAPKRQAWVGRLWSESRVDDLQEEIALQGETDELKNEVINLATAYNFVTPYTSFLAIPDSELTGGARDTIANARARKAKILAAHKDAVALSRSAMPPGDPVLKVKAPIDAQQVTAYFPFGLEKDLRYDPTTEHWKVRFLVPKTVADGEYEVKIVILKKNGEVEMAQIPYTIDSSGPEVDIKTRIAGDEVRIEVSSKEILRSATILLEDGTRIDLALNAEKTMLVGTLPLFETGSMTLVVADEAKNETLEVIDASDLGKDILAGVVR